MGLGADWRSLSLGEWSETVRQWSRSQGKPQVAPPTEDEFEAAILAARGVSLH